MKKLTSNQARPKCLENISSPIDPIDAKPKVPNYKLLGTAHLEAKNTHKVSMGGVMVIGRLVTKIIWCLMATGGAESNWAPKRETTLAVSLKIVLGD